MNVDINIILRPFCRTLYVLFLVVVFRVMSWLSFISNPIILLSFLLVLLEKTTDKHVFHVRHFQFFITLIPFHGVSIWITIASISSFLQFLTPLFLVLHPVSCSMGNHFLPLSLVIQGLYLTASLAEIILSLK